MKKPLNIKILFTGGGSGGHLSAATAILDKVLESYEIPATNILYIGSKLGMSGEKESISVEEKVMKPRKDITYVSIRAGKLQRTFDKNFFPLLFGVFGGIIDSFKQIKAFKPDVVISTGGFVTVPVTFVAWLFKIPIYLHEQTAAVGLTNKTASKFAKRIYISFESSRKYFAPNKVLYTGNAVRSQIFNTDSNSELAQLIKSIKSNKLPTLLFMGGGQGSHLINTVIESSMEQLAQKYNVILQTGDNKIFNDFDRLQEKKSNLPNELSQRIIITKYVNAEEIGTVFNLADLFIGRAGANSVYEMAALRKKSIFVPIPWVTHNEQYLNAKALADLGVAEILEEKSFNIENLEKLIAEVLERKLTFNEELINKVFPLNATELIVNDLKLEELSSGN